jgi:hypothetical protein
LFVVSTGRINTIEAVRWNCSGKARWRWIRFFFYGAGVSTYEEVGGEFECVFDGLGSIGYANEGAFDGLGSIGYANEGAFDALGSTGCANGHDGFGSGNPQVDTVRMVVLESYTSGRKKANIAVGR